MKDLELKNEQQLKATILAEEAKYKANFWKFMKTIYEGESTEQREQPVIIEGKV